MTMRTDIVPGLVYDDAMRAIDFLCEAFGFARQLVVPGPAGTVMHAQLTLDDAMVMLGSAGAGQRERFGMVTPAETGGLVTGTLTVTVADPDAHHARAVAAGASIITPPHDNEYGGRSYATRDPGGYVWNFGSYDPWAGRD